MSSRREEKQRARAKRLAREAELKAQARRKRRRISLTALVSTLLLLVGAVVAAEGGASQAGSASSIPHGVLAPLTTLGRLSPPSPPGAVGAEGVPAPRAPALAGLRSASGGSVVDGIRCQGAEQVLFHIHAHLTLFVDGAARAVPYGIGIPRGQVSATPTGPYVATGSCFYWLHTHAADGIIHIESPVNRTYTLGNFFDIWGQKLGPTELGPVSGPVTALYNGRVFRGDPRDIPLTRHAQIQLEVGRPVVAPVRISFPAGL